jgi:hypothetical protein
MDRLPHWPLKSARLHYTVICHEDAPGIRGGSTARAPGCAMLYGIRPDALDEEPTIAVESVRLRKDRVSFIDSSGKAIIKPTIPAPIDDVGDFADGLARVEGHGYIGETGNWVIRGGYFGDDFSDGLARVTLDDATQRSGKSDVYLDPAGNIVLKMRSFRAGAFIEGMAVYEGEGKPSLRSFQPGNLKYADYPGLKGYIDKTGKLVIPPAFADAGRFVEGLARVALDGYCHLALPDGNREGTPTTGYPSSCGGAPRDAVTACAVGFINPAGTFTIPPAFESARDFQEQLAAVRIGGRWGFIDTGGELAIAPRFEQAQSFHEGLAAVRMNGRWGFIDRSGTVTIPAKFEKVEPFSDSLAIAYENDRPFYIDRQGQPKIVGRFLQATPFVRGLAAVLLDEQHVVWINRTGAAVFEYSRKMR